MKFSATKWLLPVLFTVGGAGAGLLYYRFFGCTTGCMITSSPIGTMLYMALIGWLLSGLFRREKEG